MIQPKNWLFRHTLMEGGREYFSERHIKSSELTLPYGAATVLLFCYLESRSYSLSYIFLWAAPLLFAIFANMITSYSYLKTRKTIYIKLFCAFELWAFFCWVSYVFFFGGAQSTDLEVARKGFLIFIITLFYLNAMQYSMILLILNSSIVCAGLLIHTNFYYAYADNHLNTASIIIVMGWFMLIRFGRAAYVIMCDNYRTIAENKRLMSRMDDMLVRDTLTNLHNRRYFDEQMTRHMALFNRDKQSFCLAILDIDYFKRVNDNFGHLTGDQLLIELGQVINQNLRKSDIFTRYGGEEFAIILPSVDVSSATDVLEKVRQMVEKHNFSINGHALTITISIGLSYARPGCTVTSLIESADTSLYRAKQSGRNNLQVAK